MKSEKLHNTQNTDFPDGQNIPEFYTNLIEINYSPFEFEFSNLLVDSKANTVFLLHALHFWFFLK